MTSSLVPLFVSPSNLIEGGSSLFLEQVKALAAHGKRLADPPGEMADKMSIDKKDPTKDDSEDSVGSSPEGEPGPASNSNAAGNAAQENQQPKRKGGRKPVSLDISFLFVASLSSWNPMWKGTPNTKTTQCSCQERYLHGPQLNMSSNLAPLDLCDL